MVYLSATATLIATVAAFFLWARRGLSAFGWLQWVLRVIAVLPLLASGVLHFTSTALMASMIPPFFPDHSPLVVLTGVLEFAGAVGLLLAAFTRVASAFLAVFMIAIFPANVYASRQTIGGLHMPSVPVRLTMQIVYILLLLIAGWGIPRRPRENRRSLHSDRSQRGARP
jgi:uncharacterized membrane protein